MKDQESLSIGFLFDDTLDSNDGVAQQVKILGSWLSQNGHSVSYLVGQTKLKKWAGGKVYSLSKNRSVTFNGNRLSIPLPANRRHISAVLRHTQLDVLHVQMPHSPFMAQRVINLADEKTAIVGTFHILPNGLLADYGTRLLKHLYGRGLKRIDQLLSVSQPAADFAKSALGLESKVLPNTIDVGKFARERGSQTINKGSIVFLGRLVKRKGCDVLIEALSLLHLKGLDLKLTVAGDGPERKRLQKMVRKMHLPPSMINFVGYIEESHKPKLLAGAQIACFPSAGGESFGVVLLEAMASGAGVVLAGDNPGYRSVLSARPELLVKAEPQLLADRLEKIIKSSSLSAELHEWQRQEVKKYDVDLIGRRLLDIYAGAIAKRNPGAHN